MPEVALTLTFGPGSDMDVITDRCWVLGCLGIEELDSSLRATFPDEATARVAFAALREHLVGPPVPVYDPLAGWVPPPVDVDTEAFAIRTPAPDTGVLAAGPERIPIVIEPGRAFGSGSHPSTRAVLDLLARGPVPARVLDVGTGTGILAIAAARLGAGVTAIDVDRSAVEVARANVERNEVSDVVRVEATPIEAIDTGFDLALVNLTIDHHERLAMVVSRLVPAGEVIAAGVLVGDQERRLESLYAGFGVTARLHESGWSALRLARRS